MRAAPAAGRQRPPRFAGGRGRGNIDMKIAWIVLLIALMAVLAACLVWILGMPGGESEQPEAAGQAPAGAAGGALRIGLIPERDIFLQRKRNNAQNHSAVLLRRHLLLYCAGVADQFDGKTLPLTHPAAKMTRKGAN